MIDGRSLSSGAAIVALLFGLAGCGSDNPLGREAVSGKVTFNGLPLDAGSINFEPQQAGGVASGAVIAEGSYNIPAHQGLPPGRYLVRINASQSAPAAIAQLPPGAPEPPGIERIPPDFNAQSQHFVEVGQDTNQFDFAIETQ